MEKAPHPARHAAAGARHFGTGFVSVLDYHNRPLIPWRGPSQENRITKNLPDDTSIP
jgi:hypothetical protein